MLGVSPEKEETRILPNSIIPTPHEEMTHASHAATTSLAMLSTLCTTNPSLQGVIMNYLAVGDSFTGDEILGMGAAMRGEDMQDILGHQVIHHCLDGIAEVVGINELRGLCACLYAEHEARIGAMNAPDDLCARFLQLTQDIDDLPLPKHELLLRYRNLVSAKIQTRADDRVEIWMVALNLLFSVIGPKRRLR